MSENVPQLHGNFHEMREFFKLQFQNVRMSKKMAESAQFIQEDKCLLGYPCRANALNRQAHSAQQIRVIAFARDMILKKLGDHFKHLLKGANRGCGVGSPCCRGFQPD